MPLGDFLRFYYPVWPLPDGNNPDPEDRYFNPKYSLLDNKKSALFDKLLLQDGYTRESLLRFLKRNLSRHSAIIAENAKLTKLAGMHTGAALTIAKKEGRELSKLLQTIAISEPVIVFRTISQELKPAAQKGESFQTTDIWSTSYDPLSSLAFGLSSVPEINLFLLCISLPAGFKGGLLVENNTVDTIKEQHEFTMAAGVKLRMDNIEEKKTLFIPLSNGKVEIFKAKIYHLSFTQ